MSDVERHTGPGSSRARIQLLPAIASSATESGYVLEVYGIGTSVLSSDQTDDNTITQRTSPVWVDLTVDWSSCVRRAERSGSLAKRVLIDCDKILKFVSGDNVQQMLGYNNLVLHNC